MKVFVITLALVGLASTATLDAQILGSRPLPTRSASVNVDGSWRMVGRDGSGNTIYERRTQDRNGNIVVQRARRDSRGNMSIISTNTIGNTNNTNNRNTNCSYNQSTNTVGDIIFGRSGNNVNCNDNGNRVDGGWYQVGQGRDNNSIYERRTRDAYGNLVIQRARRNSNGTFTILNSRTANGNDKQWQKEQKRQEKEWKKQQKQDDKAYKHSQQDDNNDQGRGRGNSKHNDRD
jgi:hypothetical protein